MPEQATTLELRCACGTVRGAVSNASAATGNRCVCYCDDCQAYARFLNGADTILDAHGGTDIFQVSPATVSFSAGLDHVACLTLRPGGLLRFYAACCDMPLANTPPRPWLPFAGLVVSCLGDGADGRPLEAVTGPSRAGVFGRFARGDHSTLHAYDRAPFGVVMHVLGMVLRWRLRGDHKRSPFFDAARKPRVTPRVLSEDELRAAQHAGDAA